MEVQQISALEKFLAYGPIGLAGLMLVLVIIAILARETTARQSGLLKFFMVVGGICFLASTAAEFFAVKSSHRLSVLVAPQNLGDQTAFPKPILRVNGERLVGNVFDVSGTVSLLVDVTNSVGAFQTVSANADQATARLARTTVEKETLEGAVQTLESEVRVRDVALREVAQTAELLNTRVEALTTTRQAPDTVEWQRAINDIGTIQRSLDSTIGGVMR